MLRATAYCSLILLLITLAAPAADGPAPSTKKAPTTAATSRSAPAGPEVTLRAVRRDGVWFGEWSVVNGSRKPVELPRRPMSVAWRGPPDVS